MEKIPLKKKIYQIKLNNIINNLYPLDHHVFLDYLQEGYKYFLKNKLFFPPAKFKQLEKVNL